MSSNLTRQIMGVNVRRKSRYSDHGRLCRRCGRPFTLAERLAFLKVCDDCKGQKSRDERIGEPDYEAKKI